MQLHEAALGTTPFYLVMVGVFYLVLIVAVGVPVCLAWSRLRHQPAIGAIRRVLLFFTILLLVGAVAQILWTTLIWGRFYYSTDYVFGYMPFLPITQAEIDAPFGTLRGELRGISLTSLNLIWLAFTIPVWILTIHIYRRRVRGSTAATLPTTCHLSNA